MTNPLLILGHGVPNRNASDLTAAAEGSLYIDTEDLPNSSPNITSENGATALSSTPVGLMGNDGLLYGQLWVSADYQTIFVNTLQDDGVIGVVPNVWVSGIQSYSLKEKPNNEIHFIYASNPNAPILDVSIMAQVNSDGTITGALASVIGGSKAGAPPAKPPASEGLSWGSVIEGGPATDGAQPTGGVSLSAQMQINGAPEYVIQGIFDNTLSDTKNEKWQGAFFGNVPAFQPSNPNANPSYIIAIQESASIGEQFPEIRIKGLDPSKISPQLTEDGGVSGLDASNDLGRLVHSRGFENFANTGTQSYELGAISYKPQPNAGRDFISGSSGAPAVSFRQISWQGSNQIGGAWVDVLPAQYAILGYWGDPSQGKVWGFGYDTGNDQGFPHNWLNVRYNSKGGDLTTPADTFSIIPLITEQSSMNLPYRTTVTFGANNKTSDDMKAGSLGGFRWSINGPPSYPDIQSAWNIQPKESPQNISKQDEIQFSILSNRSSKPNTWQTLVFNADGNLYIEGKEINLSQADWARFQKIAESGKFPTFAKNYLSKNATVTSHINITDALSQLKTLQEKYDEIEKRVAKREGLSK